MNNFSTAFTLVLEDFAKIGWVAGKAATDYIIIPAAKFGVVFAFGVGTIAALFAFLSSL